VQYAGELGADPVVFMNDIPLKKIIETKPDKIIISPGPKTPEYAGVSVEVVQKLGKKIPILGVCLGCQVIGYAFGGKVVQAKRLMHGKTSLIHHDGSRLFKGLPNPFEATRYHSLALDRATLPKCLKVTAESKDGEIMAIEHESYPIFGTQFHPESILTREGKKIIKNFLEVA
jgi:anthranilate synthase/aminodeoxychorismate synthase-like glutamine amidotransferase